MEKFTISDLERIAKSGANLVVTAKEGRTVSDFERVAKKLANNSTLTIIGVEKFTANDLERIAKIKPGFITFSS